MTGSMYNSVRGRTQRQKQIVSATSEIALRFASPFSPLLPHLFRQSPTVVGVSMIINKRKVDGGQRERGPDDGKGLVKRTKEEKREGRAGGRGEGMVNAQGERGFLERAFINHESQATPNLPPCSSRRCLPLVLFLARSTCILVLHAKLPSLLHSSSDGERRSLFLFPLFQGPFPSPSPPLPLLPFRWPWTCPDEIRLESQDN